MKNVSRYRSGAGTVPVPKKIKKRKKARKKVMDQEHSLHVLVLTLISTGVPLYGLLCFKARFIKSHKII
jgi:hypothetical protein